MPQYTSEPKGSVYPLPAAEASAVGARQDVPRGARTDMGVGHAFELPSLGLTKTGSRYRTSPKGALCMRMVTQSAPFREGAHADCAFPLRCGAREAWSNPPPACGALWRMAQLGKCARATPRQPAGRVVPGSADLGSESGLTERRTLAAGPHGTERRARTIYAPTDSYGLMEAILSPTCTFPDSSSSTFSSSLELVTMSMI